MTQHQIEYLAWLVLQVYDGGQYASRYWFAFLLTLGFQLSRKKLSPRQYRVMWRCLLLVAVAWGGWGLVRYLPSWTNWYEAYLFLPCIVASVGLAKLHGRMRGKLYWPMVGAIVIVISAAYWVMAPYRSPEMQHLKVNPWNRPEVTAEIRHSLTGKGWGEWTCNGDLRWFYVDSWSVAFLAAVVAVPPRRERTDVDPGN